MARGERSESLAPIEAPSSPDPRAAGPALLPAGFRLEPHGVGEMLDVALEVFRQRFFALVGTAFVLMVGAQLLEQAIGNWSKAVAERGDERGAILVGLLAVPVVLLLSLLVAAVTGRLAYSTLEGKPISMRASLAFVLGRLVFLVCVVVLEFLAILLGFFACILPALFLGWKFVLASTVVVLERVSPVEALRRSWTLTRDLFPIGFAVFLLGQLLFLPFHAAASIPQDPEMRRQFLSQLGLPHSGLESFWIPMLVFTLFGAVGMAYQAVLITLFYVETRIRREGFDLLVSLERLKHRDARAAQPELSAVPSRAVDSGTPTWEGLA